MTEVGFLSKYLSRYVIFFVIGGFIVAESFFLVQIQDYPVMWDESSFIAIGKFIYSSGQSGIWEDIRPPGLPLLLGFFWKVGLGNVFVYRAIGFLSALGVLFLTYLLGKEFMRPHFAALSAILVAFSPVFFLYSKIMMSDVISSFFVQARN